jgi:hypothetical protein
MKRIQRDDLAGQVAPREQLRNGAPLIAFVCDFDLAENCGILRLYQRDQVTGMTIASDATNGFAINRNTLHGITWTSRRLWSWHGRRLESAQGLFQAREIKQCQSTPDGGIAGQA